MRDKTETAKIGQCEYTVGMIPLEPAIDIYTECEKMIGPSFAELFMAAKSSDGDNDKLLEALKGALMSYVQRTDSARKKIMAKQFAEVTLVKDPKGVDKFVPLHPIYDVHFQGRIGEFHGWLVFAIRTNFWDFSCVLDSVSDQDGIQGLFQSMSPTT